MIYPILITFVMLAICFLCALAAQVPPENR